MEPARSVSTELGEGDARLGVEATFRGYKFQLKVTWATVAGVSPDFRDLRWCGRTGLLSARACRARRALSGAGSIVAKLAQALASSVLSK
eukprot:5643924-Prymnesium_polylepis.1